MDKLFYPYFFACEASELSDQLISTLEQSLIIFKTILNNFV